MVRKQSKMCHHEKFKKRRKVTSTKLKVKLVQFWYKLEILILVQQTYKKSRNDYTSPLNISIVLSVEVPSKSPSS